MVGISKLVMDEMCGNSSRRPQAYLYAMLVNYAKPALNIDMVTEIIRKSARKLTPVR